MTTLARTPPGLPPSPPPEQDAAPVSQQGEPPIPEVELEEQFDLEKLGRQRPPVFKSAISELLFCFSLLTTAMMAEYFISGFNIILPAISSSLHIPPESRTWPTSVFALVTGAFLLPFGRLADMYGGHVVYVSGLAWLLIWCLIGGFSTNTAMLIVTRAAAGLGPAAFLPASIMLLGRTYRPGPRKNLVFSLYGACAPLGFFLGIIIAGVAAECLTWRWYFFLGAIVLALVVVVSIFVVPSDWKEARNARSSSTAADVKMDYLGIATTVPALVLLVFAITDGAHAPDGWSTPYIIVTFILGALFLAAAVYVEGWVSSQPLLPFDIFKAKYMGRMVVALFFCYGSFGVFLLYASFYIQEIMQKNPLITAVWFAPMAGGGIILATVGGFTMHFLPGRVLLIIAGLGGVTQMILFAVAPESYGESGAGAGTFWAFVFPAMIGATLCIDIVYNVSNVYITTNVPRRRQGVAGAIIFSLLFLGTSFFLGFADVAVAETEAHNGRGEGEATSAHSYKVAFWFGTAVAAVALILFCFIGIGSAKSQLLIEEQERLEGGGDGGEGEESRS